MGGAALSGILASAAVGGGLAGGATLISLLGQAKMTERMQSYFAKLKMGKAAMSFVQANKTIGAGVASAATAVTSLDLSEQRDTIANVFRHVRLGGSTLNVMFASAAVGATDTAVRLGEIYQGAVGSESFAGIGDRPYKGYNKVYISLL